MTLFRALMSWIGRHLVIFLLVLLAILIVPAGTRYVQNAIGDYQTVISDLAELENVQQVLEREYAQTRQDIVARARSLEQATSEQLARRIEEIDREVRVLTNAHFQSPISIGTRGIEVNVASIKGQGQSEARKYLLAHEREILSTLLWMLDAPKELERLRRAHEAVFAELKRNEQQQAQLKKDHWIARHNPLAESYRELKDLGAEHARLSSENQAAWDAYSAQKAKVDQGPKHAPSAAIPPGLPATALAPIEETLLELRLMARENWLGRQLSGVTGDVKSAVFLAVQIIAVVVATPFLIKAFFYFVLAPLASRWPPIALLPKVAGAIHVLPGADPVDTAPGPSVSRTVGIDASTELLVHPEYLQSTPHEAESDTKLFLSSRFWLASLAADLCAVTRIRSGHPAAIVLSATHDPLSEIEILAIPPASGLVLQPRHVVGVLQRRDQPVKITSHWRLGSLHAWLTMQLRFLVFHGPVTLIVSGCRGVRIEPAQAGRSINQAATIGFSPNLSYFSRRSETFFGYLTGKQPLLHDAFVGTGGSYVYQEIPAGRGKSGVTGKRLEGLTDAFLNVFGI